jgi:dolichol-phosphate mannosyltransferase
MTEFTISIVVPAFNEAENLPVLVEAVAKSVAWAPGYEIVICDDGSTDGTRQVLRQLSTQNPNLRYVSLSRSFGHQAALRAGIDHAAGDCVISMDADLQHPPELIQQMVGSWRSGAQIVSCIREDDQSLPFFKRITSILFYRFLSFLGDIDIRPGSSDFRLLDRKVADVLRSLPEADLFFRGVVPSLGFSSDTIRYHPRKRLYGHTKYSFSKMCRLALTGVLSTSVKPLRISIVFSLITVCFAVAFGLYSAGVYFFSDSAVPGWTSVIAVVSILGTMQLLVLGVVGEYLGQVLKETRQRPAYIVRDTNVSD